MDIFYFALRNEKYNCFLKEDTMMPMMYMDDAMKATLNLMEAEKSKIKINYSYNVAGFSFTPKEIYEEIKKYFPAFEIEYNPDFRQNIADSWVKSIDDTEAQRDWNWQPQFNFEEMVKTMIFHLKEKLGIS
ncbi:MAG: hypothetical protein R2771_13810 [Saprospiraceae bacterium]